MTTDDFLNFSGDNLHIYESFIMLNAKLNNPCYDKVMVSISGGWDSDILLDLCVKLDVGKKLLYVFFDTGLEYEATKEHLQFLESKYDIKIERQKAIKPIPLCCRQYGQPFLSKYVSEMISRLQRYDFKWEDKKFEDLLKEYPKCKAALRWWCNQWGDGDEPSKSRFNIAYNKYLKEFMVINPPLHKISNKCCYYTKKKVAEKYKKDNNIKLSMTGVRKSEGGARASAYKTCFSINKDKGVADEYRPIFWYLNADKLTYDRTNDVKHSRCYTQYGLCRTGCVGCPYGRNFEKEIEIVQKYEPKLHKAILKIFGDSYEYTRKYKEFVRSKK